ncbi:MAG: hypothetical protein RI894_2475 [Bacteroidota bacterium]|jgi:hypothetical protein
MKAIFTIIIAIFALTTVNAQSAVHTTVSTTLANDNVTVVSATTFAKKASANSVLFSANQHATAQRLVITNVATDEVLTSNTMEVSTEFSVEKLQNLELSSATIATERVALEIED